MMTLMVLVWPVRAIAWTYMLVGLALDLVFNVVFGPVIFVEAPWGHGWLFTARCKSHRKDGDWRQRIADWVCDGWLNPFDAGHC